MYHKTFLQMQNFNDFPYVMLYKQAEEQKYEWASCSYSLCDNSGVKL